MEYESEYNDSYDDHYDNYYNYGNITEEDHPSLTKIVEFMDTYYVPAVILVGLLANLLSFIVFVSTRLKTLSLSVYLAALAVSDSGFLCALAVGWLDYVGVELFHKNGWCQMTVYSSYVFSFLSTWLVVGFTVERYIAVCFPLKRPEMCTVARAKVVVVCLFVFALVSYSVTFRITGVRTVGRFTVCQSLTEYNSVYRGLTYVDAIVTFFVPFISILGFNICIVYKIYYFYTKQEYNPAANDLNYTRHHQRHQLNKERLGNRAQVKVTKLLLIISTVFIIICLPSYVIRIVAFVNNMMALANSRFDILLQQLFQFLFYSNFATNFFLYSLCSNKFRDALSKLTWQMKYKVANCACSGRQ